MRVGMIGAGGIARRHAETLERAGEQLIAVCDVDPGAREALARAWGAAVYADGLELLARERLDALVVATPPAAHREIAVAALERGLAVYLEKPLARTLEDAQAIVEAAERTGAVCAVGYQWRAIGWLDGLRERLASERVGLLAGRIHGAARPRSWFVDRAQGGGQVLERASHLIDLERALGGEVVRVQALGS